MEDMQMANKNISLRNNKIKITVWYQYTAIEVAKIQNTDIKCSWRCGGTGTFLHCWRCKNVGGNAATLKDSVVVSKHDIYRSEIPRWYPLEQSIYP